MSLIFKTQSFLDKHLGNLSGMLDVERRFYRVDWLKSEQIACLKKSLVYGNKMLNYEEHKTRRQSLSCAMSFGVQGWRAVGWRAIWNRKSSQISWIIGILAQKCRKGEIMFILLNIEPGSEDASFARNWATRHPRAYEYIIQKCLDHIQFSNKDIYLSGIIAQLIWDKNINIVRAKADSLASVLEEDVPDLKGKFKVIKSPIPKAVNSQYEQFMGMCKQFFESQVSKGELNYAI